jgi:hypothetical protein
VNINVKGRPTSKCTLRLSDMRLALFDLVGGGRLINLLCYATGIQPRLPCGATMPSLFMQEV